MSIEHDLPTVFLIDMDVEGIEAIDENGAIDLEETARLRDLIARFRA